MLIKRGNTRCLFSPPISTIGVNGCGMVYLDACLRFNVQYSFRDIHKLLLCFIDLNECISYLHWLSIPSL